MFNFGELEELASNKKFKPQNIDTIHYLFWDRGISLKEFNELPIPYIVMMVKVLAYFKEKEAEAYKKK